MKHWDIKRTPRETWGAADYAMHSLLSNMVSLGGVVLDPLTGKNAAVLIVFNRRKPSESIIVKELLV